MHSANVCLDINNVIRGLDQEQVYKYLGINECNGIQHSSRKEKIRKEFYRRARTVLKTELNSANRIEAIKTLAIPVVTYSFNIIIWKLTNIKKLDTKVRKLLTTYRMHCPKPDVDRLYIPRKEGGRGLIQLELTYKTTTIKLEKYLDSSKDWMLQLVKQHENSKKAHSVIKKSEKYKRDLGVEINTDEKLSCTKQAKILKKAAKKEGLKKIKENWENKPLHGQYPTRTNSADVDLLNTHQWLRGAGLKAETEGFIIAAQDQSLFTRNFQAEILRNGVNPNCRFCDKHKETIDPLVSGCPVLTPSEYKNRYDRIGQYIHWKACQNFHLPCAAKWYEHKPPQVGENDKVTILWDFTINTDRTIQANRPDIVIKNNKQKTYLMIDMTVPTDRNVSAKEFDKLSKYTDWQIEIERLWHLKTSIVPVVIRAFGLVDKNVRSHIKKLPGNPACRSYKRLSSTAVCTS